MQLAEGKKGPKPRQAISWVWTQHKGTQQWQHPCALTQHGGDAHQGCRIPALCPGTQRDGLAQQCRKLSSFSVFLRLFFARLGRAVGVGHNLFHHTGCAGGTGSGRSCHSPCRGGCAGELITAQTLAAHGNSSFQLPVPITSTHTCI